MLPRNSMSRIFHGAMPFLALHDCRERFDVPKPYCRKYIVPELKHRFDYSGERERERENGAGA